MDAPLYDHNKAFDETVMENCGGSMLFVGRTLEGVAKYAMKRAA